MSFDVIFCFVFSGSFPLDFFKATVQGRRDGIPEVEESVLIQTNIHEHRLETLLDILDLAFKNSPDDVLVAFTLDSVFLEHAILKKGDASFESFDVYDNGISLGWIGVADAENAFDFFDHVVVG